MNPAEQNPLLQSVEGIQAVLRERNYIADLPMATALRLVMALRKPLLVEGPAGVGKTQVAKTLAEVLDTRLIRLQCYEGLDTAQALYEWNYPKQMLHIRLTENSGESLAQREAEIFSEAYLLRRPLLEAISQDQPPVLLIDEIDRTDEEFEAFLLELLAEFQVTIPELGTLKARHRPYVILTSNRSRELSDALRRRCLYLWQNYPSFEKEVEIIRARLPGINERLAQKIARVVAHLRELPLNKAPGVAESLDWAEALVSLHKESLDMSILEQTWGVIIKDKDDLALVEAHKARIAELVV
ncbi:AAA family ATPase [Meiothermus ruber]|uniref:ATPase n=1 Tax=Meiothermus ruber (strain ATCC 35948 / DSM 1279 / VKM B-1258 / 21) TaxID=504728 RepID=D3PRQ4_MEIRD|nr:MoxR family ATPase [Meiothermus ruber]ADD28137.1 ATPase associated with various cellular activities AAA_5 [Meiothermus ruber DSM 1279]AGK04607.1 ATPase [Meiothermus ruber DSM 1279]MCL6528848.1 MoxR family ATPase [Meiothermus ruber]GAO75087.1 ATPase [Meiothermus ruber H328]